MTRLASIFAAFAALVVSVVPLFTGTALAAEPGNQYFNGTWQRTDLPVADLLVSRTWMWGPEASTGLMDEAYAESPGGQREVQYFDKSRMEITRPDGDAGSIWYVTNGLLVVELMTGRMQIGDNSFEERSPATVPVAGDQDDPDGPTYETFDGLVDEQAKPIGERYTERLDRSGEVTVDPSLSASDVVAGHFDDVTRHTIAAPFWEFMNSSGTVYENGQFTDALMFESPLFATGRPVAEAYWAEVLIAGTPTDVLMQCFERRCLTYNPSNPDGWQVEAGNVGLHYYDWRYGDAQDPASGNPPAADPGVGDLPPDDPGPGDPPANDSPPSDPLPGEPGPNGPDAPEDLTAVPSSLSELPGSSNFYPIIALEWEGRSSDEDGFDVYAWEPGRNASRIAQVQAGTEHYEWRGGTPGQEVCFSIVAVRDDAGSEPSDSACTTFPGSPSLTSPGPGYVSTDRAVTFEWSPVEGVLDYIVCLHFAGYEDAPCDDGSVLIAAGDHAYAGADIEYEWDIHTSLAPSGERTEFIWSVVACYPQLDDPSRTGYCEPGSQWRPLTVDLTDGLVAPELLDPADSEWVTSRHVAFDFMRTDDAYGYVLCIFTYEHRYDHCDFNLATDEAMVFWTDHQSSNGSFDVEIRPDYAPDGQVSELYWTVASCSNDAYTCPGQGEHRTLLIDITGNALVAPTLANPADGYVATGGYVDLEWDLVAGADSYRVCWELAGDSCPDSPTYSSGYFDSSTDSFRLYLQPGEYAEIEWTVGACDEHGDCIWQSQTRTLILDLPMDPPNLISAVVDPQRPSRYTFSWNPVPAASYYVLCIAEPGANCPNETGGFVKFSTNDGTETELTVDIPRSLAPDNELTHLNWTMAACTYDDHCYWQYSYQPIYIDRVPDPALDAPYLRSAFAPNPDPTSYQFTWDLVPDADRYIICVYEQGADCAGETGNYAKSSILGPAVNEMSMNVPLWLAPDGQVTTLRWTVGACDDLLRCNWQSSYGTIYVDNS